MGSIEEGVRRDIRKMRIKEPYPALVNLAIEVARRLDDGVEEKNLASLSRELRLTLEQINLGSLDDDHEEDAVERLINKKR